MKIMICGSMTFAREMLDLQKNLAPLGHNAQIPTDCFLVAKGKINPNDLDADFEHCKKNDIHRLHFKMIEESDALVVLNKPKNGVDGYVGVSVIMEIAVAYHLKKKIFLMYDLPSYHRQRWAWEVALTRPIILNGDIKKIR